MGVFYVKNIFPTLLLIVSAMGGGCDMSGEGVQTPTPDVVVTSDTFSDASVSCDGKADNPACYVDATPTDAHSPSDTLGTDASGNDDTAASDTSSPTVDTWSGDTLPQTDTAVDYDNQLCPNLGCTLKVQDGGWRCGNINIGSFDDLQMMCF
ncbi:MAG: hypothetical protein PHQ18_03195 [Patescibacteria group bacterium]|nr:hypothetical protein [Patescibacteria group bacterium]